MSIELSLVDVVGVRNEKFVSVLDHRKLGACINPCRIPLLERRIVISRIIQLFDLKGCYDRMGIILCRRTALF